MVDLNLGGAEAGEKLQTVESAKDGVDKKSKDSRIHIELENLSHLTEGFKTGVMETIAAAMDNIQSCTMKNVREVENHCCNVILYAN